MKAGILFIFCFFVYCWPSEQNVNSQEGEGRGGSWSLPFLPPNFCLEQSLVRDRMLTYGREEGGEGGRTYSAGASLRKVVQASTHT